MFVKVSLYYSILRLQRLRSQATINAIIVLQWET